MTQENETVSSHKSVTYGPSLDGLFGPIIGVIVEAWIVGAVAQGAPVSARVLLVALDAMEIDIQAVVKALLSVHPVWAMTFPVRPARASVRTGPDGAAVAAAILGGVHATWREWVEGEGKVTWETREVLLVGEGFRLDVLQSLGLDGGVE